MVNLNFLENSKQNNNFLQQMTGICKQFGCILIFRACNLWGI